ncbi:hypothetical protein ULMS_28660 [Patiriisocius marinistellae]|uniref:C1q domain-containing protein n=1 Tax=Patiriisocius marinistellae TaxID=2494560 RepID=A0A5J4G0S0_9FLAO|nr:hypothetical protein [Patiriisocius marinistellae]GEQ87358.1 hypothetical protein ULMS_28660 [Patiriisocius marinistellae]
MRYIFIFLALSSTLYSQVGINTSNPLATLDVNGSLMVRSIPLENDASNAKNSILITNNNEIKQIPLLEIYKEEFKTAVKGSFDSASAISISLLGGSGIVPFDNEDFDINDEFDTTTHKFTAKQDGIYRIYVQVKQNNLHISTNYGVRILKNNTVIQKNSFANLSVALVNITTPVRTVQTLVELNENDEIKFEIESSLVSVATNLVGSSANSFFTIERIR